MASPVSDERFAWRTALAIMGTLSVISLAVRLIQLWYGLSPIFTDEFVVSLVYIPTIVLSAGWLLEKRNKTRGC